MSGALRQPAPRHGSAALGAAAAVLMTLSP